MIFHLATLAFVIFKVLNMIDWSWWLVFMPSIIVIVVKLVALAAGLFLVLRKF